MKASRQSRLESIKPMYREKGSPQLTATGSTATMREAKTRIWTKVMFVMAPIAPAIISPYSDRPNKWKQTMSVQYKNDQSLLPCVTTCMATFFAPVITLLFSWYWSKLPFRLSKDVMSNYLNPLIETVFFSTCCVVTHLVVCTLCIVAGNRRQCLLCVFICCVLQK